MPLVFLIILILRIPSLFEPYWYGDEGIYLTIGQALQRGAILYRDIWDNKTPLLYLIYGLHPTLLWAKISAIFAVLGTVYFVKKISRSNLAALFCGIFLSLPYFEGTIANAELYFTLPIATGAYLILKDRGFLIVGGCLSTAFFLKIPAVFDFFGLFLAYFIINRKLKPFIYILLPFLIFILIFSLYFFFHRAFGDFLAATFSQNTAYVTIASGSFSRLSNPLFLRGIVLLGICSLLLRLYLNKKISRELLFFAFWFGFSLYGALLSNRPYAHYLLQIVPPGIILGWYLTKNFKKYFLFLIPLYSIFYILYSTFNASFRLPTINYYQNFINYFTGRKSWVSYANWFDPQTVDNYHVTHYLQHQKSALQNPDMLVWGDNAFIYALSKTPPATKFIQAHHLTTIGHENYDLIIDQITTKPPKFIVVIHPIRFPFPKLDHLIAKNYRLIKVIGRQHLYQVLGDVADKSAN